MTSYSIEPNERVTFKILYEDDSLFVVAKPPGVVTQPGLAHDGDSLLNGLFARWGDRLQALGRARDFGLVHRLDRQTSGLVVGALRARVYDALREAFSRHEVRKFYWAVVRGRPRQDTGVIRKPIQESAGRDPATPAPQRRLRGDAKSRMKLSRISGSGKAAVTAYRVLQAGRAASLLECRTLTGRLHQVRVHLESIGCPILGDELYAPPAVARGAPRLALHAHRLAFKHPGTGTAVDITTAWPSDLRALLKRLGLERPDLDDRVERFHEFEGDPIGEQEPPVGQRPPAR